MDHQSSTEIKAKFKKCPLVSEPEFILIFICLFERMLSATISADISNLITMFVGPSKRVSYFNETVPKSICVDIVNETTITKKSFGWNTVLCGDGEPLDRSRGTKYEVVFKINKMEFGFLIGYVFGSIQDVDFEEGLGYGSNEKNSVGIRVALNGFYLWAADGYRSKKQLKCESEGGPPKFPKQGQIWRVSWDLIGNEMEISGLNQQETNWISMTHYAMKQEHHDVIPAFCLLYEDDSITLLSQ